MFDILFPMHQFDFHTKFLIQVLCQMLGRINRTMLISAALHIWCRTWRREF